MIKFKTKSVLHVALEKLESDSESILPLNYTNIMSIKALILKTLRNGLGLVIVFLDWLSRPKKTIRSDVDQKAAQDAMRGLSLYQFYACPFCVKTRRAIHELNVGIEVRDINKNAAHREQLESATGKVKVPCLRIEEGDNVRWMNESNDIIKFLQMRAA